MRACHETPGLRLTLWRSDGAPFVARANAWPTDVDPWVRALWCTGSVVFKAPPPLAAPRRSMCTVGWHRAAIPFDLELLAHASKFVRQQVEDAQDDTDFDVPLDQAMPDMDGPRGTAVLHWLRRWLRPRRGLFTPVEPAVRVVAVLHG